MFYFSMLRNNPDNGLGADRLSRHLVIFFQDVWALYFVFIEEKATDWRGVTWHRRRLATGLCVRSLHRERETKPEISRPYPRHFPFKVRPGANLSCMSVVHIVSIVMCVHVGRSALQRYEKLHEFKQGSDLFSDSPAVRRYPAAWTPYAVIFKAGCGGRVFTGVCTITQRHSVSTCINVRATLSTSSIN